MLYVRHYVGHRKHWSTRSLLCFGQLRPASGESSGQTELSVDTVNAVNSVEVLDAGNLEASGSSLAGGNRRVGEEVFPDLMVISIPRYKHTAYCLP
jgi:hypothetical protein